MKIKFFFLLIPFIFFQCDSPKNDFQKRFSQNEQDSLFTNIIIYIYINAPESNDTTKWDPKYRAFYQKKSDLFHMVNYVISKEGWHYFFLARPVGNGAKKRGVIGKFHLTEGSLKPTDFEEIINTPHLDENEVISRGEFLFSKLIEQGNLNKYMNMKHYIEWPDSTLVYDRAAHQWRIPNKKM